MRTMAMNKQSGINRIEAPLCTNNSELQKLGPVGGQPGFKGGNVGQQGIGNADCLQLSALADGTIVLDAESAAGLLYMIEEEKMARDLYDSFAELTGSVVFDKISASEQKHMDTLLLVAEKAGIDLSGVSTTAGIFNNTDLQNLYNSLLAQGSVSLDAAYEVGVLVEQADVADLQQYNAGMEVSVIGTVYAHLEAASGHHLAAFTSYAALV